MFSINHLVCINSLGTVNHPYQLEKNWNPSEIQVPRCQARINLQAGFPKDISSPPALLKFSAQLNTKSLVYTYIVSAKKRKINPVDV